MSTPSIEKTLNCYEAGSVLRYHTHPRLGRFMQGDGAHSWGVGALLLQLHPNPSRELLIAALLHDTGERFAGDLPAPVKRAHPDLAALHALLEGKMRSSTIYRGDYKLDCVDDKAWLKMCDMLECIMFVSLTLPETLKSPPWVSLADGIVTLSQHLVAVPLNNIRDLIDAAIVRQGVHEASGEFDYTQYAKA